MAEAPEHEEKHDGEHENGGSGLDMAIADGSNNEVD